jgi:hypothetical protein
MDPMVRGQLAVAVGQDQQRRQRGDAADQHGDQVVRRIVGPVHVLDDEHRGPRRSPQLLDHQVVDLVCCDPRRERLLERRGRSACQVPDGTERPRDHEVVAAADEDSGRRVQTIDEAPDERGLADPRLARDEDHPTVASSGRLPGRGEPPQRRLALEQIHGASTIERPPVPVTSGRGAPGPAAADPRRPGRVRPTDD